MTHTEFVTAYREGRITVEFDPAPAGKFLSARLLLPLMILPVLGAGVGLALMGWLWSGLLVIALGFVAPRLIKRSAPHFLLTQMLGDANLYADVQRAGIMRLDKPHMQHPKTDTL
ncbi:MAG: hypothetical protein ABL891_07670 [Burkholderiales bacterium]